MPRATLSPKARWVARPGSHRFRSPALAAGAWKRTQYRVHPPAKPSGHGEKVTNTFATGRQRTAIGKEELPGRRRSRLKGHCPWGPCRRAILGDKRRVGFGGIAPTSKSSAPRGSTQEGHEAPLARRRPGYSSAGCSPAEPASASPGNCIVRLDRAQTQPPIGDLGVIPFPTGLPSAPAEQLHPNRDPTKVYFFRP
jgi:hypothetical protein